MRNSEKLAEALFHLVAHAKDEDAQAVIDALDAFKTETRRSYDGVKKQPFAGRLIDAIEEAAQYRNVETSLT